jgi:hypothetical protein
VALDPVKVAPSSASTARRLIPSKDKSAHLELYGQKCLSTSPDLGDEQICEIYVIFNRPGVAEAVLQTASVLIHSFSQSVSHSSFYSRYSQHHKYQIIRAR